MSGAPHSYLHAAQQADLLLDVARQSVPDGTEEVVLNMITGQRSFRRSGSGYGPPQQGNTQPAGGYGRNQGGHSSGGSGGSGGNGGNVPSKPATIHTKCHKCRGYGHYAADCASKQRYVPKDK